MNNLFHKISQKKVSDRVFDQVRALITSGQLHPGDRLPPERELTGLLDVSRSSVREAILKLECLGFVEQRHGEGTFVRSVTEPPLTDFLRELVTCRVYADAAEDRTIQAQLLAQHTAIVKAIRNGNGPEARQTMAAHLRFAEETAQQAGKIPASPETATP